MNLVWQNYRRGGSEKLALLAMADWCDDQGGNLYPSISTVAKKICVSECQARRIVHAFIDEGVLEVVGNHFGGAKSQSRRYRLNVEMLASTPSTNATPSISATPRMDARYPSHGCALPLAPMRANPSLTIKEPSGAALALKIAAQVIDHLNQKAGRNYQPVSANLNLISARLKEGATLNQCQAVIDSKVDDWSTNPKMVTFLRPKTLFNATNFAQYIGELASVTHAGDESWE